MKEVTKDEFFNFVGPQDACVSVENPYKYPYTSLFKLRHNRKLVGKIVSGYTNNIENQYPIVQRYYISE